MNFRGILRGRLLLATKFLPLRYAVKTWLVSIAGLAKDTGRFRWAFARDRIQVLRQTAALVPQLLREKKMQFRDAGITSEQQLNFMLRLPDTGSGDNPVATRGS